MAITIQQRTKTGEWEALSDLLFADPEEAAEVLEGLADPMEPAKAATGEFRLVMSAR